MTPTAFSPSLAVSVAPGTSSWQAPAAKRTLTLLLFPALPPLDSKKPRLLRNRRAIRLGGFRAQSRFTARTSSAVTGSLRKLSAKATPTSEILVRAADSKISSTEPACAALAPPSGFTIITVTS